MNYIGNGEKVKCDNCIFNCVLRKAKLTHEKTLLLLISFISLTLCCGHCSCLLALGEHRSSEIYQDWIVNTVTLVNFANPIIIVSVA